MLAASTLGKDSEQQEKYDNWIKELLSKGKLIGSPKLDGIRCLNHPDLGCIARSFKKIPNRYIRFQIELYCPYGIDGEIVTYDDDGKIKSFNEIQSDVMSVDGQPNFRFLIFDDFTYPEHSFVSRSRTAQTKIQDAGCSKLVYIEHESFNTWDEIQAYTKDCLRLGFEGAMFRSPTGRYKQGRATVKQGWLFKAKHFEDDEGTVTGVYEEIDKHGEPKGRLGGLVLSTKFGQIQVGSGYSAQQRQEYWDNSGLVIGKIVTYKYQPFGMNTKPRFPTFKGFRDPLDLSSLPF